MQSSIPIVYCALLFAGLLAGFEIAVHHGMGVPPRALREDTQILLRQAMVRRLRVLAPMLFIPSLLLISIVTIQERHEAQSWLRYASVAALLVWGIIRIVRTVPINSATLEWSPDAPPENWQALVERTERFHVVAAWSAVLAFVCILASSIHGR